MSSNNWYRKFDIYFGGIGRFLFVVAQLSTFLFLVGYTIYQLCIGNFKWLMHNFMVFPLIVLGTIIIVTILKTYKKTDGDSHSNKNPTS